ncbi:hypothetical protein EVAR_73599_1 [Eumeta japonica]|uniref:MADF domain-containing protein n=1 Tax=Eumeta variegata TaxID=151549 RepID=A0A4C1STV9_EUMVA|nr:hypothetical protein EVAR_73599_1 [Eumeta japonica]
MPNFNIITKCNFGQTYRSLWCRICGKIFENLADFREHLETENHGSIWQQDTTDCENILEQDEGEENDGKYIEISTASSQSESLTESENSTDILQRFTPFSATPQPPVDNNCSPNLASFPNEAIQNSWPFQDHLIEEIMENVTNHDGFNQHGLDQIKILMCLCQQKAIVVATESERASPIKEIGNHVTAEVIAEKPSSSALLVKVQCADYSVNLKLNTEPLSTLNSHLNDTDNELYSSGDNSTAPLPDFLIHKMIQLYRTFPQLWDPNHLDFNSRILRRQAWVNLTMEFNSIVGKQFSWRTLHRKLTDYAKYYKKLVTEKGNYENLINKWAFYEDFKVLDDVVTLEYKTSDFSKRSCKQRNIELMCNRLQDEHNLQLTTERLKNRLIELRAQYRSAKKQRLKCLNAQQQFSANDFEFYEALSFLDDHIDPFNCDICKMEFKKLTDYNQHMKKNMRRKAAYYFATSAVAVYGKCLPYLWPQIYHTQQSCASC